MESNVKKEKKRLHFGILFSTSDNTCQNEIWTGMVEYARQHDIHLTAFIGSYQTTHYDFASHFDTCYEAIKASRSLDGVILCSGFIAQVIGNDEFDKYTDVLSKDIPQVSVSFIVPGIPSVLVDNTGGMFSAVDHLIKCHGKKKIGFIKGPDGHLEAEERLEGYKKALEANGIPFDEDYILPGYFSIQSGTEAIEEMLDVRQLTVDALAISDDETAIGALDELKRRGIMVPTEVAVTGFDDDRTSATFIPSISTVRQDFLKIGFESMETLHNMVTGKPVTEVNYVAPLLVTRQSCGCLEKEFSNDDAHHDDISHSADALYSFVLRKFMPLFQEHVPQAKIEEWVAVLVERIKEEPFRKDRFLYMLDEILVNYSHYSKEFDLWNDALSILTRGVEIYNKELERVHSIMSALVYATTLIHDICLKEGKSKVFDLNNTWLNLRRITGALVLIFDIDSLAEEVCNSLPALSINTALVGLYHNPIKSGQPNADRTIDTLIGFDGERRFNIKNNNWNPILFSDYSTIEHFDFERERRDLYFIPLFFKDEEVGVMLLPYDINIPVDAYETLRVNISTAVKGAELLSTIQTLSITDELTGLLNRRGFFQFVYSRIQHLYRSNEVLPIVLFLDMDGLKFINDTYGHKEGDIAISVFANILKESVREEDIVGRMGGDEFVVFSTVKASEHSQRLMNRIRMKLDDYNSKKLHPYNVAGSIGSVILDSATKECFEAAMLKADSVLYEEKMEKKKKGLSR